MYRFGIRLNPSPHSGLRNQAAKLGRPPPEYERRHDVVLGERLADLPNHVVERAVLAHLPEGGPGRLGRSRGQEVSIVASFRTATLAATASAMPKAWHHWTGTHPSGTIPPPCPRCGISPPPRHSRSTMVSPSVRPTED